MVKSGVKLLNRLDIRRIEELWFMIMKQMDMKFGIESEEARGLLELAWNLGLNVVGVSFHVGSMCYDGSVFYEAVKLANDVFQQGDEVGYKFKILDVGGGFPGDNNADISFQEIVDNLLHGFNEFFPPDRGVKVIAEPGRYYVTSSFTTVCGVIAKRVLAPSKTSLDDRSMYYLNDGVYGSFSNIILEQFVPRPRTLNGEYKDTELYESTIWGPTCDSIDCISKSIKLPKLSVGDWLMFDNMGAYTTCCATHFNGFEKPDTYYYMSK